MRLGTRLSLALNRSFEKFLLCSIYPSRRLKNGIVAYQVGLAWIEIACDRIPTYVPI